ncbi:Kv channel-interacting protein 1-like isoform X2 [Aphelenchoides besseyi]|nr:Kv channel-interacting protein 1-like isoform X2 [Aphelenchoides besseyi]
MAIPINEDPYHHMGPTLWPSKDDLDLTPLPYYRPESIEDIIEKTKFTKREVQFYYRSFKQVPRESCKSNDKYLSCVQRFIPTFFPQSSNCNRYANLVFNSLDSDGRGHITFEEFIISLSVMTRGSIEEKLNWVFSLYDENKRNFIGQEEIINVTSAIYELLSRQVRSHARRTDVFIHAQHVYMKLTEGKSKKISRCQFIDACLDESIVTSLSQLDTKL